MNNIRILPPEIVAKIAAGEVVERPASVVKELLENSLDAGARSIEIILEGAGKTKIEIADDGCGIDKDDLAALFSRHATSKISKLEDLYSISSLGFRGEALYSIAAVADVSLRSKTRREPSGWEIHVHPDQKCQIKPAAARDGTLIQVKELFFNTPARKKFLKSNTAELNHILDIVTPYTLLYPGVRFSLHHEKRTLLELAAASNPLQRICDCLHLEKEHIIEGEKNFEAENITIRLILGDINIQRSRKDMQYIFINNRPVQERALSFHLNEIFRLLFAPGVYPFFCVFITMDPQDLDVNVHPAKREVKIKDELYLISLLRPFCEQLLMTKSKAKQATVFNLPQTPHEISKVQSVHPQTASSPGLRQEQYALSLEQSIALFKTEITQDKKDSLKEKLSRSRYLGNLLKKYLLFESQDSLLIIDQHAAQERYTFEKLHAQFEKGDIEMQKLLAPILISLSTQEALLWEEYKETLLKLGFETTLFDKNTLGLHAHPQLVTQPEAAVHSLLAGEKLAKLDNARLARMACRSSVMAGFAMNKEQAEFQRAALLSCADPFTCPHGRPTVIEILENDLQKQFLRK